MELEQLTSRDSLSRQKLLPGHGKACSRTISNSSIPHSGIGSEALDDLSQRSDSFRSLDTGVPRKNKLSWLNSQLIGCNTEFYSPFGERQITYADHTASGRSVQYIEDYIINDVLPFYGMHDSFPYNSSSLVFIFILQCD